MPLRGLDAGASAALVVSECQNNMINADYPRAVETGLAQAAADRGMIPRIAALADSCRGAGVPVLHATLVPRPGYVGLGTRNPLLGRIAKRGTPPGEDFAKGWEIHPDLPVAEGDLRVPRHHGVTPFGDPALIQLLRNLDVTTVILAGVSTNVALAGSAVEAVNAGFAVILAEDATTGAPAEAHEFMVTRYFPLLAEVAGADEIATALAGRTA